VTEQLRLRKAGDGMAYTRIPSSLAWMVEKAVEEALVKIEKEHPPFAHDAIEGQTMVVLMRDR
jgi:hypothetical protein